VTALLELVGLDAGYAGTAVVRELDLTVFEGEVVALLGANGAGKTTTLLTAAGVLPVLGGDAFVLGRSVRGQRPYQLVRRGLAFVPEQRGLFATLTVAENLRLARRRGAPCWTDVIPLFPALQNLLDRRVGLLSGGEQQMLALAKALVLQPRLLLVDELSLGLAPILVDRLLQMMRTTAKEKGIGVLLVEQHAQMALTVADRAYVLRRGRRAFAGPAAELAERPDLLHTSYLGDTPSSMEAKL
jgi:branched-chain amino acid transport system ATP-binding protein